METKQSLHGAGVYYFALAGAKEQNIFHSVFEYEYAVKALSTLPNVRLLAYVFDEASVQCVLRCEHDWVDVLDDIRTAFDNLHERCWNKRRQVLAEQATVLLIDEQAHLADLVMQLHDWPRYVGRVADASLWPWSSDKYYRAMNPPAWLDTESMLNLLVHSRRNRAQHYEAVMQKPVGPIFNLVDGNHPDYLAIARNTFIQRFMHQKAMEESAYSAADIQRLFDDACQLVARQFGVEVADLCDQLQRRRFNHLMPLVVWLLRAREVPIDDIAKLTNEDEVRLELWMRNISADHTPNIRNQLMRRWLPRAAFSA